MQAYQEMQVWDGLTGARIEFDWPGEKQGGTIAYMNENLNLTSGLLKRIGEMGGVEVLDGEKVEDIVLGETTEDADFSSWPVVQLSGGRKLAARLLVGADGANSPVRAFAGIGSKGWDYDRHGVVATIQLDGNGWGGSPHPLCMDRPTRHCSITPILQHSGVTSPTDSQVSQDRPVRAKAGAHQLLHQIRLFVRAFGRAKTGQGFAAVSIANCFETLGCEVQCLFPA